MKPIYQKTVIILIAALFIGSSFLSVQSRSNPISSPEIPEIPETPETQPQIYSCGCILPPDSVIPDPQPTNLDDDVPMEWNWQDATYKGQTGNWMTSIKKQGECGSCWAFGATATSEAMVNIQKGNPDIDLDLSEQQLVSCTPGSTCRGGDTRAAWEYARQNGGHITEACFPYEGVDAYGCTMYDCDNEPVLCEYRCDDWINYTVPISDHTYYISPPNSLIKHTIVNHGPVATVMQVYSNFNYYRGGIYENPSGDFIGNHIVVIVGYNESENYWICKNSWGERWGEDGYFRIRYGASEIGRYTFYVNIDSAFLNFPPTADAGGLYHATVQQSINFDSTKSSDIDNNIISYHWDFGDQTTSTEPNPTHTYLSKGIYDVTLTVTDSHGEQSTAQTASFIDIWSIDDSWTYDAALTILPDALESPLSLTCDIISENLEAQVTDSTTDTYTLDFSGDTTGSISFEYDFINTPFDFKLHGTLHRTTIQGSIHLTKAGFGIEEINYHIHGKAKLILTTPVIPLRLRIPMPFDLSITKTYSVPHTLIGTFPAVDNTWIIPSGTSSTTFDFSTLFGLISKSYIDEDIPEKAITLKYTEKQTLTINNVPYDTFKISNPTQTSQYHYAPSLNNIIKVYGLDTDLCSFHLTLNSPQ